MKNKNINKKYYCVSKYQTLLIKMTFCLQLMFTIIKKNNYKIKL